MGVGEGGKVLTGLLKCCRRERWDQEKADTCRQIKRVDRERTKVESDMLYKERLLLFNVKVVACFN